MKKLVTLTLAVGLLAACATLQQLQQKLDPNKRAALGHITSQCVQNMKDKTQPAPCEFVDINQGYVVLKDQVGVAQYLVMPTEPVGGIESPAVLADNAPNYWEAAWFSRKFLIAKLGHDTARGNIGMAVNSPQGRTQDTLHIHVDCVKPDVVKALDAYKDKLTHDWSPLPFPLAGHTYQAMRVYSEDLHGESPFSLLSVQGDMADKTLVIVGAVFARNINGFILLSDASEPLKGHLASGEELLDHTCAGAK